MTTAATKATTRPAIVYPETDHMAENTLQRLMTEFLRPLIERFLREAITGSLAKKKQYRPLRALAPCRVGADQFWYFREGNPKKSVAPDVYVLTGVHETAAPPSWFLWQLKDPPLFALEIVSQDTEKDYDVWTTYEHTGVRELIVYDPDAPKLSEASRGRARVRWQAYRRNEKGALVLADSSNSDRIQSEALCCWLRLEGEGELRRIRIGTGLRGQDLFPSTDEHERAEKERERAEKERERAEKERALQLVASEQAARKVLEAQLQQLLAERNARAVTPPTKRKPRSS